MYDFSPALVFTSQPRYTINKHCSHFIRKEIFYGYQIFRLGRRRLSVRPERRAQAQTRAQAPQVDRQQGRPHRRSTRSSRCLSAQSSSTCRCPPSTCMPKSSTVSCCCFASRTASARSSPPAFRVRGQGLLHVRQKAVHRALLCRGGAHRHGARRRADIVGRAAGQGLSSAAADRQRQLCKRN